MPKVLIPIATGFEEIEAVNIIDVLRRGGIDVIMASLTNEMLIKGANGIVVQCDCEITSVCMNDMDMIVLPGGWGGTNALASDVNVQRILKEMNAKNKWIGAICAAPFALFKAGVLKAGYTCYPSVEEQIDVDGYQEEDNVVETDNIMTSRGPATAICFGLAIVKKLVSDEMSESLRGGLLAQSCCQ